MTAPPLIPGGVDHSRIDRMVLAFDDALAGNPETSIEPFLPTGPERRPALVEMVRHALERAGQGPGKDPRLVDRRESPACLEYYLLRYPELLTEPEAVVALLAAERSCQATAGIPDFQIGEEIGRGSSGVVYQAVQLSLKRSVALKVLTDEVYVRQENRARLRQEAEILGKLDHPNIVKIFCVSGPDDVPHLALEFCPGGSLEEALKARSFAPHEAAALIATLARAVHTAHLAGIIHRDLKPANILFKQDGSPCVGDFGLARRMDGSPRLTTHSAAIGTPAYSAPEQTGLLGPDAPAVGPLADIFALGSILYECLAGRRAFEGDGSREVCLAIVRKEPLPLGAVPRDLQTICLKCLSKDPAERYPTALALAEDLERFRAGLPIHARPLPWWERVFRWCGRNRVVTGLLAGLFLCLILATGALWQTTTEREAAVAARADAETAQKALEAQVRNHRQVLLDYLQRTRDPRFLQDAQSRAALIEMVTQVAQFCEDEERLRPADPHIILTRIEIYTALASMAHTQGRTSEISPWIPRIAELVKHPALANPTDPVLRSRLADVLTVLPPYLFGPNYPHLVSDWCHRALALRETAIQNQDRVARLANSQTRIRLAAHLLQQLEYASAVRLLERNRDDLRQWVAEYPESPEYRYTQVDNWMLLAAACLYARHPQDALPCWREVCAVGKAVVEENPGQPKPIIQWILASHNLRERGVGEMPDADLLQLHRQAERLLHDCLRLDPENGSYASWLADLYEREPILDAEHDLARACVAQGKAIAVLETRLERTPEDWSTRFRLLDARARGVLLAQRARDGTGAAQEAQRSVNAVSEMLAKFGTDPAVQAWACRPSSNLITALRHADRLAEARVANEAILAYLTEYARRHPDTSVWQRGLSEAYTQLGKTHWREGHHDDAGRALVQATAVARELSRRFPDQIGVLNDRLCRLGRFYEERQDYPRAVACLDERARHAAPDDKTLARDYLALVEELPPEAARLREHCEAEAARRMSNLTP